MTVPSPKFYALVPAAGVGRRMGSDQPKQYLSLLGKTIMEHTLERLLVESRLQRVVVTISAQDTQWRELPILRDSRVKVITGGEERYHSVLNGLQYLATECADSDWVLVHDVARPCISPADVHHLIEQLVDDPVGGILAVPVSDTIKRVDTNNIISTTVDRSCLWQAQTPQMFRLGVLLAALSRAVENNCSVTDEASAIELSGLYPKVVEGSATNIKITRPEDLSLAEFYLQQDSL
jgi:2-C-methyl-D-erythritol 4-phosphate cytidylyltransferase